MLPTLCNSADRMPLGDKLIAAYGAEKKVTILELRQNPDREIAALLGMAQGNVARTLQRAKEKLRKALKDEGVEV